MTNVHSSCENTFVKSGYVLLLGCQKVNQIKILQSNITFLTVPHFKNKTAKLKKFNKI